MMGFNKNCLFALLLVGVILSSTNCSRTPSAPLLADGPQSFASRQVRYMMPLDLMTLLRVSFPVHLDSILTNCKELTSDNRSLVGDNSAASGSPVFSEPSSGFVRWYTDCVRAYLRGFEDDETDVEKAKIFYGSHLVEALPDQQDRLRTLFSSLPSDLQKAAVMDQIERLIGPSEIIEDFGYFRDSEALADHLLQLSQVSGQTVPEALREIMFYISVRDEFLSY